MFGYIGHCMVVVCGAWGRGCRWAQLCLIDYVNVRFNWILDTGGDWIFASCLLNYLIYVFDRVFMREVPQTFDDSIFAYGIVSTISIIKSLRQEGLHYQKFVPRRLSSQWLI